MNEHEAGLAVFLTPRHRARWKTVGAEHDDLHHFERRLDPAYAERLTGEAAHPAAVVARLLADGAPPERCVVFAESVGWGAELPLAEGVGELLWYGGGFASCVPGRLALYVGEYRSVRVLRRLSVGRAG